MIWGISGYNEPKTLDVAFDVIGDIVLSAASQQYGGFTVPNIELILEPYAEKSYEKGIEKYEALAFPESGRKLNRFKDVQKNSVRDSRGLNISLTVFLPAAETILLSQ